MRIYNNKIVLVLLVALLASCSKDLELSAGGGAAQNKIVNFAVESFSKKSVAYSKATVLEKESLIHRGYLFFFDSKGNYSGYEDIDVATIVGNGSANLSFKVSNPSYSNGCDIICVFNYDKDNFNSNFSSLTKDNVSSFFPMSSDFLKSVQADLKKDVPEIGVPMFVNDFTDSNKAVHEIYRSLAKVSLSVDKNLKIEHESHSHTFDVADLKYGVVNSAPKGSIGFTSLENIDSFEDNDGAAYSGGNVVTFDYSPASSDKGVIDGDEQFAYLYEYPSSSYGVDGVLVDEKAFSEKRIAIIIEHDDHYSGDKLYYKLNLADKLLNNYFDIVRNHHYRIVIKAVNSRGYDTIDEAYKMPPSNIEYEVFDENGETTVSNGQYAVSMDEVLNYDNIQIYGHNSTDVEFNDICYIMPEQMDGVDIANMTNKVQFSVISSDGTLEVETVLNQFADNPKLTDERRSIKLKLTGEGSCKIALKINLGNIEIGRDVITIQKHGGENAFDAHPGQLRLKNQTLVPSSWNSQDLDFGARYDADSSQTVIYMGSNATPTGYVSMDGYVAANASKDSYPIFEEKSRVGYYNYYDENDELKKTKIELVQLAPFYLGHFGNKSEPGSHTHYNALICEKIEEIVDKVSWNGGKTGGYMPYSTNSSTTQYNPDWVYGEYGNSGLNRYLNLVEGRDICEYIVEHNETDVKTSAVRYCYQKNDVNGDGILTPNEPIEWYLPAQNQLIAFWINEREFKTDLPRYDFKNPNDDTYPRYCSCSETANGQPEYVSEFTNVAYINMLEGQIIIAGEKNTWGGYHVRCVRGIDFGN